MLNLISGAAQPVSIYEWGISFDGVTAGAVPATVELMQSTQATAGTATAGTVVQVGGRAITAQPTFSYNYTSEPTVLTAIEAFYVPQYMGTFIKQYPLGLEPDTDLSGGSVKGMAIRVTVSANVNVLCYARFGIGG